MKGVMTIFLKMRHFQWIQTGNWVLLEETGREKQRFSISFLGNTSIRGVLQKVCFFDYFPDETKEKDMGKTADELMPVYNVIQELCKELMDGEEEEKSIRGYDQEQVLELIRELQEKEAEKKMIIGIFIMVIGIIFVIGAVWMTLAYGCHRLFMVATCWIYALVMFLIGLVRVITASKRKISLEK